MLYHLKLSEEDFEQVRSKQKTIELRLFDRKRQKICVNDQIEFLSLKDKQQKIRARVIALHRFDSFQDLYQHLPLEKLGYQDPTLADPKEMEQSYPLSQQKRWGVLGIEIELLEHWRNRETTATSVYICTVLRHLPELAGITLDPHGWAEVDLLIQGVNKKHFLDRNLLEYIVQTDDKQRYSFNEDKTKIRANQGHSIPVDVELEELEPPEFLFHGTGEKSVDSILKNGVIAKTRLYVHLSANEQTARQVGGRHGKPIIFRVSTGQMYRDGIKFFRSVNGVWLTKYIPAFYLEKI